MRIEIQHISKKFNSQWIFKNVNLHLETGNCYVITGPNGSGKSTLLSLISGYLTPTSGSIVYRQDALEIDRESIYSHITMTAPYLELIEEYTLSELIDFHFSFAPYIDGENKESLLLFLKLAHAKNKQIRYFSSGMKQRVKLGLSFFTDRSILLLDEPTVNLDHEGIRWYQEIIPLYSSNKLTVICSNQPHEYMFTDSIIKITDFQ